MALESWEGTRASRCVEEGLSRSFSGCGGKPSFPSTSAGDMKEFPRVPLRGEGYCGVGGAPLGTPLGLAQRKRASPRGEAGTSGFLSVSDSDLRVPAELGQESQASMPVARGSASLLSSHGRGLGLQDALKKDSRGLSRVVAGNPGFHQLLPVTLGSFSGCL